MADCLCVGLRLLIWLTDSPVENAKFFRSNFEAINFSIRPADDIIVGTFKER